MKRKYTLKLATGVEVHSFVAEPTDIVVIEDVIVDCHDFQKVYGSVLRRIWRACFLLVKSGHKIYAVALLRDYVRLRYQLTATLTDCRHAVETVEDSIMNSEV